MVSKKFCWGNAIPLTTSYQLVSYIVEDPRYLKKRFFST